MGIYCTYFISINPACLPWSHPEREYCNICSVLATPDPRYGPANLYAGPRSLGNLHPSIQISKVFKKSFSIWQLWSGWNSLAIVLLVFIVYTQFLKSEKVKRLLSGLNENTIIVVISIFSVWMFPLIFTWSLWGRGCQASAWVRSSRRWESSE